jgi:hypothetical protein
MKELYITPKGEQSPIIKISRVILNRDQPGSIVTYVTEDAKFVKASGLYTIHPINVDIKIDPNHQIDNTIKFFSGIHYPKNPP